MYTLELRPTLQTKVKNYESQTRFHIMGSEIPNQILPSYLNSSHFYNITLKVLAFFHFELLTNKLLHRFVHSRSNTITPNKSKNIANSNLEPKKSEVKRYAHIK